MRASRPVGSDRIPGHCAPTLAAAFHATAAALSDAPSLHVPAAGMTVSWKAYQRRVQALAGGLWALGVRRGDPIAVMLGHRPEFHLIDTAVMQLGAVPVMLADETESFEIGEILTRERCVMAFCDADSGGRMRAALEGVPAHVPLIGVDDNGPERALPDVMLLGRGEPQVDSAWRSVAPDDLVLRIYPRAGCRDPVLLTHREVIAAWRRLHEDCVMRPAGRILTGPAAAELADRLFIQHAQLLYGHTISCLPSPRAIAEAAAQIRPTFWVLPPAVLAELRAVAESALAGLPESDRRDDRILAAVRARIGLDAGAVNLAGAAPTPPDLVDFFAAIGVPLLEMPGLSESISPVVQLIREGRTPPLRQLVVSR